MSLSQLVWMVSSGIIEWRCSAWANEERKDSNENQSTREEFNLFQCHFQNSVQEKKMKKNKRKILIQNEDQTSEIESRPKTGREKKQAVFLPHSSAQKYRTNIRSKTKENKERENRKQHRIQREKRDVWLNGTILLLNGESIVVVANSRDWLWIVVRVHTVWLRFRILSYWYLKSIDQDIEPKFEQRWSTRAIAFCKAFDVAIRSASIRRMLRKDFHAEGIERCMWRSLRSTMEPRWCSWRRATPYQWGICRWRVVRLRHWRWTNSAEEIVD